MKHFITFICFIAFSYLVTADPGKECNAELSRFVGLVKQKVYEDAHQLWQVLNENCSGMHVAIYAYGEVTLKELIKLDESTAPEESPYLEQIKTLYDDWIKNFPEQKGKVLAKKGRLVVDYKTGTEKEAFEFYNQAFLEDGASFENPKELYTYFSLGISLYKNKEPGYDSLEKVLDRYEVVQSSLSASERKYLKIREELLNKGGGNLSEERLLKQNEDHLKRIERAKLGLDSKMVPLMKCEDLVTLYANDFDNNKDNIQWLKKASRRMTLKKCTKDLLFSDIVKAQHAVEPSANTASYLAIVAQEDGNNSKAKSYYKEALNLEVDRIKKSGYAMHLAKLYQKKVSQSADYAKEAIEFNMSNGEAYLFLADLYAKGANDCGKTVFEKRAVFWLSESLAKKAAQRDVLSASKANQLREYYKTKAPSKAEIFHEGRSGEKLNIRCWINETVTIPSID